MEVALSLTIELPELTQDWEIDSWRAQRALCTRTQEKGAVPPKDSDPDLPVNVQSPADMWVGGGLPQGRGTECSSTCMGFFEGDHHYLHYLHHNFSSVQSLSHVHLFSTPWTVVRQASLSITNY